jgi:hypothetical protein
MLSSQNKEDIARNKHIVKEISDVLLLCSRQNIAIRGGGHTEDKNNSMAILRHVSKLLKHDEILVSPGYPIPYFEDKLHILRYTDKSNRN